VTASLGAGGEVGYNADMDVRPLTDDDLDAALALWARTDHLGPVPRAEVEGLRRASPELVLGAWLDGSLVGVVLGAYDGRRGWINRLAVADTARRQGVGARLLAAVEENLAVRGCVQVNLLVYADNDGGRSFWDRHGYEATDGVVLYHRRLDGSADRPSC
jgi:ribosomal protein S18 acetylase RimI-like enzyme